ncbi:MAG: peptidase M20, partial [Thermoproteota archaeon]
MDRSKVFNQIDRDIGSHIERVRELVRHISVSPENRGILSCASLVKKYLEEIGCKARLVETKGNPVVYGEYDVGADRTVLVYM